jgi:hypothetical protein
LSLAPEFFCVSWLNASVVLDFVWHNGVSRVFW